MQEPLQDSTLINRLVDWAVQQDLIRAMLLTSSRANPNAPRDRLSDYDIILYMQDTAPFIHNEGWLQAPGPILVQFRDQHEQHGMQVYTRLVIYRDGTKIDFTISPVAVLQQILAEPYLPDSLAIGYQVLLDKDNITATLLPPTFRAHIPTKPTEQEFLALVEEFWWETSYVAKNLWRDELFPAKYSFDAVMKFDLLRRLLEWFIELDHDWSLKPGAHGRGLKRRLPPEIWARVESTFAGADIEENWQALFRTTTLFRDIAIIVAGHLGYPYPQELDRNVTGYLEKIRAQNV